MKVFSLFAAIITACAVLVSGCKTIPSEATIKGVSESVGRAAGYAVELGKTKTEVKEAIVKVLDVIVKVVPAEGQTFIAAWKPIIDEEVDKLVADGKLKAEDAVLTKNMLYIACDGIDLVFNRYPKAREYKNLVSAAVSGFVNGYKSVVTPVDGARAEYDKDAYEILRKKFESK